MSSQVDVQAEVDVADALPEFADAFPFERFNGMQSAVLPAVLQTDENVVVSAPTASGKTGVAEVAICATLRAGGTALFVAPLRALTNEKEREWERFEDLGYTVTVVTGERDLDPRRARQADILVMTPEKLDSATRKHDSQRYSFVQSVDCCVVDEVHLLDSDRRGSVLEVTVTRLRRLADPRVVALSATMENMDDVAAWLDAPAETTFAFGAAARPVPLDAGVRTYSPGENAFADKYRRLYRALDLAEPHIRDGAGVLAFVASRRDAVEAGRRAGEELVDRGVDCGVRGDVDRHRAARAFDDDRLRETVLDGVAFHHAGLSTGDKARVEDWFRDGDVQLLVSTSTLAWGVNLPARCVVVRDTTYHDPLEGEVDMSGIDLRQMLGRAGRPGFDDHGHAWVITTPDRAAKYRRLLRQGQTIDSRLGDDLAVHLNAEIELGTITSEADARAWWADTFHAVRTGTTESDDNDASRHSQLRQGIETLVERGFVERDGPGGTLSPTPLGRLTSRYYLRLETARAFADLAERGEADTAAILRTVAQAVEFDSVSARAAEEEAIETVLDGRQPDLNPGHRKVLAILKAGMADSTPSALAGDAWAIRRNADRLLAALRGICDRFGAPAAANRVCRVAARLDTGVPPDAVGLTAIDGVGPARAQTIASAGLTSPAAVRSTGTGGLVAAGLGEAVAASIVENAHALPAVTVDWDGVPESIPREERAMHDVTVSSTAGGARVGIALLVNGVEMTTTTTYLGQATVPLGVFGAPVESLEFCVRITFPALPLDPLERTRTVRVDDS